MMSNDRAVKTKGLMNNVLGLQYMYLLNPFSGLLAMHLWLCFQGVKESLSDVSEQII